MKKGNTIKIKKKTKKKNQLIILFLTLTLVILLMIFNLILNTNRLPELLTLFRTPKPSPTNIPYLLQPSPTNIPDKSINSSLVNKWKTYTNTAYGFQVTYPTLGINFPQVVECGKHISQHQATYRNINNQTINYIDITIDGFYDLAVYKFPGTLHDYIYSQDNNVTSEYSLIPILNTNADDAVLFSNPQNAYATSDSAPFGHTIALYKKGGYIFDLHGWIEAGYGCLPLYQLSNSENELHYNPNDQRFVHEIFLQNKNWDVSKSIRFL